MQSECHTHTDCTALVPVPEGDWKAFYWSLIWIWLYFGTWWGIRLYQVGTTMVTVFKGLKHCCKCRIYYFSVLPQERDFFFFQSFLRRRPSSFSPSSRSQKRRVCHSPTEMRCYAALVARSRKISHFTYRSEVSAASYHWMWSSESLTVTSPSGQQ